MNPNENDIWVGLAGCELTVDSFEFGQGISISKTFARLIVPFMMSFVRPTATNPLGTSVRAVKGGFEFDMRAQLYIPKDIKKPDEFDLINTGWLLGALLRLRTTPRVMLVVYASAAFADGPNLERDMELWPLEVEPQSLVMGSEGIATIREGDLEWVKEHWMQCALLMRRHSEFNLALQTFAKSQFARRESMALLAMWGALESLFSPARSELSFRISSNIAVFLEPPGERRLALQEEVAKLYNSRCTAAHSSERECEKELVKTYCLVKRVITKFIEDGHVPTKSELKGRMFGA